MPLQLRLVRQDPVQTAVQARVVNLAFLDLLQPTALSRTIQLAQITKRPLTRTVGCPDRLHQRPVGVILTVLTALMRPQKHPDPILSSASRRLQEGKSALHRLLKNPDCK